LPLPYSRRRPARSNFRAFEDLGRSPAEAIANLGADASSTPVCLAELRYDPEALPHASHPAARSWPARVDVLK
jgi:hypothetical protein